MIFSTEHSLRNNVAFESQPTFPAIIELHHFYVPVLHLVVHWLAGHHPYRFRESSVSIKSAPESQLYYIIHPCSRPSTSSEKYHKGIDNMEINGAILKVRQAERQPALTILHQSYSQSSPTSRRQMVNKFLASVGQSLEQLAGTNTKTLSNLHWLSIRTR